MAADTRVMGVMAIGAHVVVVQLVVVVMGSCSSGRRRGHHLHLLALVALASAEEAPILEHVL